MRLMKNIQIAAFCLVAASCYTESQEFTRSECIVKIKIDWQVEGKEKWEKMEAMADKVIGAKQSGYKGVIPNAAFSGERSEYLYFQYGDQCKEKKTMTEKLLENHVVPELSNPPGLMILDETVSPGPETINVFGDDWIDGAVPWRNKEAQ